MKAECRIRSKAILRIADCELRNSVENCNPQSRGFTLIEIVITLVVLSIAAIGVLSVFATGMRGSADPLLISQATQLAQGELDTVIGIKIASGFNAAALPAVSQACKTQPSLLPGFNCTLDICFVPAGNLNDTSTCATVTLYKRVMVTVTNVTIGNVTAVTLLTNY